MSKQNLVPIRDSQGASRRATPHHVSPTLVDYRLPVSLAPGFATATIAHGATDPNQFEPGYAVSARSAGGDVRLLLQGCGISAAKDITATIGGVRVPVRVSTQGFGPGREQLSLLVPRSLFGKRKREVMITAGGRPSTWSM